MKKSIYYLFSIILVLHITYHSPQQTTYAKTDITRITKNTCTFTLNSNHKQTNIVYDKNNIMYIITIEHIDATPKLSNNIYKISYTASKKWTAYFYAKILQNKFLSCYSPHVTALTGKISDYSLKRNSNTSCILNIKYKYLFTTSITGIKSVILNGKIRTSIL